MIAEYMGEVVLRTVLVEEESVGQNMPVSAASTI